MGSPRVWSHVPATDRCGGGALAITVAQETLWCVGAESVFGKRQLVSRLALPCGAECGGNAGQNDELRRGRIAAIAAQKSAGSTSKAGRCQA